MSPQADLFAGRGAVDSGLPVPKVWSVAQVNRSVRLLLDESMPRLWVEGEVANFTRHRSGHCYFSLKDGTAQMRCVMFRREAVRLPADPSDGTTVRLLGSVTLYEARGVYQFVAARLEAAQEGGMWRLAFDRLRKRLEAEGLTDPARKRPLPSFPRSVGVVTSPGGAALRDVAATMARRSPWVRLVVRATRVQGEGAAREIAAAVSRVAASGVDAVLVARGGGSVEDLWAFNEEPVARAVAASPVPVVSGVGHETDVTLCDLVADLRAATPSAAAEAVAPAREAVESRLNASAARLAKSLAALARARRSRLEWARGALDRRIRRRAAHRRAGVEHGRDRLVAAVQGRIRRDAARLAREAAAMEALSPLSTLARGYAVPLDDGGRLLRTTDDFAPGADFRLRVVDGNVPCKVRP